MKVCFSAGDISKSDKIINSLKTSIDGVEFFTYGDIKSMIKESTLRHIFFDRLVFSEKVFVDAENELNVLKNYLMEYSSTTTVVLICQSEDSDIIPLFKKVYNNYLYTPVVASPLTINILSEFITGDISSLKVKYFKEELKEVKALTSKHLEESKPVEQVEKVGFFKGLFGGKKKSTSKNEIAKDISEGLKGEGNTVNDVSKIGADLVSGTFTTGADIGVKPPVIGVPLKNDDEKDFDLNGTVPVSDGNSNLEDENNLESEDLGIGDFGELHTDTDFFDLDEVEGVEEELSRNISKYIEVDKDYEEEFELGATIVIGDRGTGVTTFIADSSVRLVDEGKNVLVVDFDYIKNGILSFIDTEKFMKEEKYRGISYHKEYEEGGVRVLSNGYGFGISKEDVGIVKGIISEGKYDFVIIDCPLDCLRMVDFDLLEMCNIKVLICGNRGSIMSTLSEFCGNSIDVAVEDLLFDNSSISVVNKIDEYDEDMIFLRKALLFSRGNWLNKLS